MRNKFLVYACVGCLTASLLLVGCGNKPAEPVSTNSQTAQTATAESATKETASVNLSTEEIAILSTAGHPAMAGKELDDAQKATLDNWETAKAYIKEKYPDVEYKATTYKATSSNVNIQFTTTDGENITVTVSTDGSCTNDYALTEAKHLFEKVITEKFTEKYGEGNVNISIDMTLKDGTDVSTISPDELLKNGTLVFNTTITVGCEEISDAYDWLTETNQYLADNGYSAMTTVNFTTPEYMSDVSTSASTSNTRLLFAKYICTARKDGNAKISIVKG